MKKNIAKSMQPQTKSLFRFKNADTKVNADINYDKTVPTSDPTIATTIVVTL